jgi:hypothetical protein
MEHYQLSAQASTRGRPGRRAAGMPAGAGLFPARRQAGPVQRLARALLDQEHWQLDELALSLLLLALALAGFAVWRGARWPPCWRRTAR